MRVPRPFGWARMAHAAIWTPGAATVRDGSSAGGLATVRGTHRADAAGVQGVLVPPGDTLCRVAPCTKFCAFSCHSRPSERSRYAHRDPPKRSHMHLVPPRDGHIFKWHLRAQVPFLNGTGYHVLAAAGNASRAGMPAGAQFSQVIAKCIKKFRPGAGKGLQFSDAQVPAEEAQQAHPK